MMPRSDSFRRNTQGSEAILLGKAMHPIVASDIFFSASGPSSPPLDLLHLVLQLSYSPSSAPWWSPTSAKEIFPPPRNPVLLPLLVDDYGH